MTRGPTSAIAFEANTLHDLLFKQSAIAFSLNAIVDVRRRRHEMIFLIYRKLFELASSKFTTGCRR